VEHFDFPSQCILVQFLDRLPTGSNWQIGDQLPFNGFSARRSSPFECMNHCQRQRRITTLLADWRQHRYAAVSKFQHGLLNLTVLVSNHDSMEAFDTNLIHLVCDRVVSIPRESVDAGSNQEVCLQFMSEAKEFVNVTFTISDMNAALRFSKQRGRLPQILEPSIAFLLFDRNACR
jgi:hypothetical protein